MGFELDPRLQADNHRLGRLAGGIVLLNRNALVPWFIVVPETDFVELYQLPDGLRLSVVGAVDGLSRFIKRYFQCDKINTAALGNQVRQLHVHVIGRRENDACWPEPIWGRLPAGPAYEKDMLDRLVAALRAELNLDSP